jgi:predicted metalloprotease
MGLSHRERLERVDHTGDDPLLDQGQKEVDPDDHFEGSAKEKA